MTRSGGRSGLRSLSTNSRTGASRTGAGATNPADTEERRGLASAPQRFAARAAWPRRRRRRVLAGVAGVVALALLVAWLVFAGPFFRVRSVDVQGAKDAAQRTAILGAAAIPEGKPLVNVDTQRAADAVIRLGTIAHVDVTRRLPSTIVVAVQPREPAIAVQLASAGGSSGAALRVVDKDGVAFASVSKPPAGVPVIAVPADAGSALLRSVTTSVLALPVAERAQIGQAAVDAQGDLTFRMRGVRVIWGSDQDASVKAAVLAVLMRQGKVGTINVTAPASPVTTP